MVPLEAPEQAAGRAATGRDSQGADARFKAFYFLFFAGLAAFAPFLTLYYEGLGMSGRQIGVLAAILPLVSLLAAGAAARYLAQPDPPV